MYCGGLFMCVDIHSSFFIKKYPHTSTNLDSILFDTIPSYIWNNQKFIFQSFYDHFWDNRKQNLQSEATMSSSNIQPVKWVKCSLLSAKYAALCRMATKSSPKLDRLFSRSASTEESFYFFDYWRCLTLVPNSTRWDPRSNEDQFLNQHHDEAGKFAFLVNEKK